MSNTPLNNIMQSLSIDQLGHAFHKMRFGMKTRIQFYTMLSVSIKSGQNVVNSLHSIADALDEIVPNHVISMVCKDVAKRMKQGNNSLSSALANYVTSEEVVLLDSAERSENRESVIHGIETIINLLSSTKESMDLVVKKSIYPMILMTVGISVFLFMRFNILPQYAELYTPDLWTGLPSYIWIIGELVKNTWPIILMALAFLFFIVRWSVGNYVGTYRITLDKIPPWNVYKAIQGSSFFDALYAMVISGISLNDAIKLISKNSSPYVQKHLNLIVNKLAHGARLEKAIVSDLFDEDVKIDLLILAKNNAIVDQLQDLSKRSVMFGRQRIEKVSGMLTAFSFALVISLIVSMYFSIILVQQQSQGAFS